MDRQIDDALKGYNSQANRVSLGNNSKIRSRRSSIRSNKSRKSRRNSVNSKKSHSRTMLGSRKHSRKVFPRKISGVSKRLYQTPGKENKPVTIIASKPKRKSGQKPLVIKETKILAKLKNKENKFKGKMIKGRTSASRRQSYAMKNREVLKIKNFNSINQSKDSRKDVPSTNIYTTQDSKATNKMSSAFRSNHFTTDDGRVIHTIELDEEMADTLASHRNIRRTLY